MRTHTYFISDMHLGLQLNNPAERERKVVRWLDSVKSSAKTIYLLGDVFDFWWEYKYVVPRGYVRFLGKLAELTDSGVAIHFYTGNHDQWAHDYLQKECGVVMHNKREYLDIDEKKFYIGHGHKVTQPLQRIFSNRLLQRLFSMLHPRWSMALGNAWSKRNRLEKGAAPTFDKNKESLYKAAEEVAQQHKVDYVVFGHRHTPTQVELSNGAQLVILGDWITGGIYADFDGEKLELKEFQDKVKAEGKSV